MKKVIITKRNAIKTNTLLYIGETLEEKIRRTKTQGEAIESVSPIIYTERKEGVKPEHDIRADKWDIAQQSMEYVNKKKREARQPKKSDEPSQQSE